ncbi:MAG: TetR family transcriptional regulator [Solirubrobacterales bacterium]
MGVQANKVRRPHDSEASRQALLEAGTALFDEVGYERATTREIGERAGVDPALIARYFGGKEGLFLAALAEGPDAQKQGPEDFEPQALLAFLLERWEERGHGPVSRALTSPDPSEDVRALVRDVVGKRLVAPLAAELADRGVPEPRLRAELLIAVALGVAVTRANGTLPALAGATLDDVGAALGPLAGALSSEP